MATRDEFRKFMSMLRAALPRFAPDIDDPATLAIWYSELGHLSLETLRDVYRQAVRSLDSFPSMRQIFEMTGEVELSTAEKGREVAERIYMAIGRWASSPNKDVQKKRDDFVGPIGVEVVRLQGGWPRLGEIVMEENATTWKAQWRGLAEIIAKRGPSAAAPDFAQLPAARQEFLKLVEKCDVTDLKTVAKK